MLKIEKELDTFASKVTDEAKKILNKKNKKATGKLLDIKNKINVSKNSFSLTFDMADYWEFVDRGVKGKGGVKADGSKWRLKRTKNTPFKYKSKIPPPKVFDKWSITKGLAPRNKGRFTKRKGLNFAIAKSVFHTGLETTNFFTKPFDKYFKKLPEDLIQAYALDVEDFLKFATK